MKINFSEYKTRLEFNAATADFTSYDYKKAVNANYLPPYKSELKDESQAMGLYLNRIDRCPPLKVSKVILQEHTAALSQPLSINWGNAESEMEDLGIEQNVDGYGENSAVSFSRMVECFLRDGLVGILVEKDPEDDRSYQNRFESSAIVRWQLARSGSNPGSVEYLLLMTAPEYTSEAETIYTLAEYSMSIEGNYILTNYKSDPIKSENKVNPIDLEYKAVEVVLGDMDQIPFYMFGRGPCDSALADVWPMDRAVLNQSSLVANVNFHQGLRTTVFTGVGPGEVQPAAEFEAVTIANPAATVTALPAGDPTAIREERNFLLQWAKRLGMRQLKQLQDDLTKQTQSAESKAKDMLSLEAWYNQLLDMMEQTLTFVYRLHYRFQNVEASEEILDSIIIVVARDFGMADNAFELQKIGIVWAYSDKFVDANGQGAGLELQRQLLMRLIADTRLTGSLEGSESETKANLIDQLRKQSVQDPRLGNPQQSTGDVLTQARNDIQSPAANGAIEQQ